MMSISSITFVSFICFAIIQNSESQYRQQPQYQQNYHHAHQQQQHQQHHQQPQQQQQHAHQQHQQHYQHQQYQQQQQQQQQHAQRYAQHTYPSPNSIKAYQTHYPTVHSSVSNPNIQKVCDIPPDLWCDSTEAAQQCGVERQCDDLRRRGQPIKITLIYEALCPYCQKFIANQLGSIFHQFQGKFILELVPWGNSRILRDGSFSCNHGQKECEANRLQSCVLDVLKVKGALPFIVCFEKNIHHYTVENAMQSCSAFIRAQYRQIRQCYDGPRGIQLQREAAQKTMTTRPNQIVEVPYILVNDYTPSVDNNNLNVMLLPQLLSKWTKLTTQKK